MKESKEQEYLLKLDTIADTYCMATIIYFFPFFFFTGVDYGCQMRPRVQNDARVTITHL